MTQSDSNRYNSFPIDFASIGQLGQPHGLKGEINLALDSEVDPATVAVGEFLFVDIDETYIPLQVRSLRKRSLDAYIIAFEGLESEEAVRFVKNHEVYVDASSLVTDDDSDDEDAVYLSDLEGYDVTLGGEPFGQIVATDQSTDNALMIIRRSSTGRELLIPFAEPFIEEIDPEAHTLALILPEGYEEMF